MRSRSQLVLALILTVSLILVACGGQTPTQANPANSGAPGGAPAAPPLRGKITFMLSEDPEGLQGFKDVVTAFNKVQPGIAVALVNVPDAGEFVKRLGADFAAGTPPDVFLINYRRFGQFAIKGAVEPLDAYLGKSQVVRLNDYYPVALDAFKLKGQQFCLPQNLSSLQIYYNKDLFAAAGLPTPKLGWTWADFLATARALTRDTNGDGKTDQYGVGLAPQALRLAPFIWAHGGQLVDDPDRPTRLTLDSGPALEAFRWFVDLQVQERVAPSKIDEATESAQSRFQRGTLGMFFQSRVVTPELRATIKEFEWDVAPLPGDKSTVTMLHSDGYCIAARSPRKDLAWAFAEFMGGPEGQKTLVTSGRTVPSNKTVAESPLFLNPTAPPANNRVYLDTALLIRRVPVMTTWLDIEDILNREIRRAFYGDATVEEAAQAAIKATVDLIHQNLQDFDNP